MRSKCPDSMTLPSGTRRAYCSSIVRPFVHSVVVWEGPLPQQTLITSSQSVREVLHLTRKTSEACAIPATPQSPRDS